MTIGAFFFANQPGTGRQAFNVGRFGWRVYIRFEDLHTTDPDKALELAKSKLREGEDSWALHTVPDQPTEEQHKAAIRDLNRSTKPPLPMQRPRKR